VYTADKRGKVLMVRCKTLILRVCLLMLAAFPVNAYTQDGPRGSIGLDFGQTSDKFGGLSPVKDFIGGADARIILFKNSGKNGLPDIVLGGELRFPSDTSQHASEFAAFVGPEFQAGSHVSLGFHIQIRKILLPPALLDGATFNRDKMLMLELPVVLKFRFGPDRHAFFELEGSPEFTPRLNYRVVVGNPSPHPSFDYGYTARGSVGYIFGKWYAKGTYQRRYMKFNESIGNPLDLYNWRSDQITGGVGLVF
jgi:hypothetical protein